MSGEMAIYIVPATLALLIKLIVLILSRSSSGRSSVFFTMVFLFLCFNLAEVLGYLRYFEGNYSTLVLRWYYVMAICSLAAILIYAMEVSKIIQNFKSFNGSVISLTLCISLFIMFTDLIISGATSIGYSLTAIRGPFYGIFQIGALLTFAGTGWFLVKGYRNSNDHLVEIQCGYTMLALAPIIIVALVVMVLMTAGFQMNAAMLLPVTTTLFLLITLRSERKHKLTDIRRHIPYSLERQTSSKIMDVFSSYAKDDLTYRECMAEIEKMLVLHKHDKNGCNVSVTARSMDIPRSSLYSIFNRLDIAHKYSK